MSGPSDWVAVRNLRSERALAGNLRAESVDEIEEAITVPERPPPLHSPRDCRTRTGTRLPRPSATRAVIDQHLLHHFATSIAPHVQAVVEEAQVMTDTLLST